MKVKFAEDSETGKMLRDIYTELSGGIEWLKWIWEQVVECEAGG